MQSLSHLLAFRTAAPHRRATLRLFRNAAYTTAPNCIAPHRPSSQRPAAPRRHGAHLHSVGLQCEYLSHPSQPRSQSPVLVELVLVVEVVVEGVVEVVVEVVGEVVVEVVP